MELIIHLVYLRLFIIYFMLQLLYNILLNCDYILS